MTRGVAETMVKAPDSININTIDGVYVDINEGFTRLTGYTREDVIGVLSSQIKIWANPDNRVALIEGLKESEKVEDLEFTYRRKDGSLGVFLMSARVITIKNVPHILSIARDITERKRAEEERVNLEAQLQQAQKIESIGRLAGGVAHDFNNMLGIILGNVDLILHEVDRSHPFHDMLQEIDKAASRSADLTRQLLAFARKQIIMPHVLDLNEVVAGMLKMLQRLIGEDIHVMWHPRTNLWSVKVDPAQIDQILANLCVNARDAIEDVGKITIETENCLFDETYCGSHAGFMPGEYVKLAVSDDGCGMGEETLAQIFEPFFTTKGVGEGTGLGLATVYGAVRQNDGFVNVYSEPGEGTTFSIYLPKYGRRNSQGQTESVAVPSPHGQETILVVEDEQSILKMTTRMLTSRGYTVLQSHTVAEAMRLAREHVGEIHLLVTDVIMPEMNGRDLASNVQALHPRIKRLFVSGYTANVIAHHGVLKEGVAFLQKPFRAEELAKKVREVLDGE